MHSDISYRSGHLTIRTDSYWDGKRRKRGLLLVPSIFSSPDLFLTVRPPLHRCIVFTSRGIADLWSDSLQTSPDSLKMLVGTSRTKVMFRLFKPQTTVEVATALKLSPAAASEQMTKLWRAGVLERTRIGQRVFYCLQREGQVGSFGNTTVETSASTFYRVIHLVFGPSRIDLSLRHTLDNVQASVLHWCSQENPKNRSNHKNN